MQGNAEGRLELPVEMEFGKRRYAADRFQVQIAVEMPVDSKRLVMTRPARSCGGDLRSNRRCG
jgi:hypothetical protein